MHIPKNLKYFLAFSSVLVSLTCFATQANALELTAKSGSATDIQAAIDKVKAAGGGIVHIPEGEFDTNGVIKFAAGISIIGAGKEKTILRKAVFSIVGQHYGYVGDGSSRVSGLSFLNGFEEQSSNFTFRGCSIFRMDHCYIEGKFSTMITVSENRFGALFDHCEFDVYTSYGIYIFGKNVWEEDIEKLLGSREDTTFIEDCTFRGFYDHPVDARQGVHYVLRHCAFDMEPNSGPIEGHGPINDGTHGTRCMEIYNNTIEVNGYSTSAGILYRSGGGVVFGNTIRNKQWGIAMAIENSPYNWPHIYPVYEQVHDLWIWNNVYQVSEASITTVWNSEDMIQENRDYFLYAKPGYAPYTYPHPWVSGTQKDNTFSHEVRNRPNPFRAGKEETLIEYNLKQPSNVTITIYDLLGQEVWRKSYEVGENGGREDNSVPWDGKNLSGKVVANGGYVCRIWVERENKYIMRKIAVAK